MRRTLHEGLPHITRSFTHTYAHVQLHVTNVKCSGIFCYIYDAEKNSACCWYRNLVLHACHVWPLSILSVNGEMTHVRTHALTHTHTQFRRARTHTQHACSHVYSSGSSAAQSTGPPLSFSGKKSLKSSFQNSCACFSENHYEMLLLSLSLALTHSLSVTTDRHNFSAEKCAQLAHFDSLSTCSYSGIVCMVPAIAAIIAFITGVTCDDKDAQSRLMVVCVCMCGVCVHAPQACM